MRKRVPASVNCGADEESLHVTIAAPCLLPDWPRGMRADMAAAYCGCDVEHTPGAPQPVKVSPRRKVWLREDLDEWLDRMAGKRAVLHGNPWLDE